MSASQADAEASTPWASMAPSISTTRVLAPAARVVVVVVVVVVARDAEETTIA